LNLRSLIIMDCSWSSLPENMECLAWLEELLISNCENMLSLPRLPMSLKELKIRYWKGTDPCPGIWESLVNLRKLELYYSNWTSLPENMERLTSLEELEIMHCTNMLSLPRLPMSLKQLEIWDWKGTYACPGIWESLVNLCKLSLRHVSWTTLPENMECLASLEELWIRNCENMLSLPRLPMSLEELKIHHWKGTDPCPGIWESLVNLCMLDLYDCNWTSLPENMERLTSLEVLKITNCTNILSLPRLPVSLEELSISGWNGTSAAWPGNGESLVNLRVLKLFNGSWTSLPENMERLTSLRELVIMNCTNILSLPRLPVSIWSLEFSLCVGVETPWDGEPHIPIWPENMEHLASLESLVIWNCKNIDPLPNLPRSLKTFELDGKDQMQDGAALLQMADASTSS